MWMQFTIRRHSLSCTAYEGGGAVRAVFLNTAGLIALASLPYWLPATVLRLRNRIFTAINGEEGLPIPGKLVDAAHLKQVYSHPAANGRSRGAALSDLFWYWLAPGPHVHQEHLEPGERYEEVARVTRRALAMPRNKAEGLAAQCMVRALNRMKIRSGSRLVRIRDLMMPVWAEFYYEVVFGERCPESARELIVGNANDVVTALKCCSLRHMKKRHRLTQFLLEEVRAGKVPLTLPERLAAEEQAFYLQGTFFNTAVVQMSEAMVHLCMAIAQHPDVQTRLVADLRDERYLDCIVAESLRLYPLFGISHRITSADISINGDATIPQGSVLCFNHPEYHRTGFKDPGRFDPDRWENLSPHAQNYIPFGVPANRPCPAAGLAPVTMRAAMRELLKRFVLYTSASHTRAAPNRGPCLAVSRTMRVAALSRVTTLAFMRIRDHWEDVWRSLVQLVLGTYMVWDARRLRLCERYFEEQTADHQETGIGNRGAMCPFSGHANRASGNISSGARVRA
jgi:hypothetical protein